MVWIWAFHRIDPVQLEQRFISSCQAGRQAARREAPLFGIGYTNCNRILPPRLPLDGSAAAGGAVRHRLQNSYH